ncbi:hypothetical protein AB0B78_01155 [Streptomyces sp. NPDC040724]|uniref:hypothetical protein n=1 Tax=Streptomyces sp. NPDC040724 TaxID=3155612 RepID=UPI0033F28402
MSERILVLGCPGSGKSTLAGQVERACGLPLVHLDDVYWGPGWERPSASEWIRRQERMAARPRWIIDGNYLPTVPVRAARADLVVVLDTSTPRCLVRVVRRALGIRAGDLSALPAAVREGAGDRVEATGDFPALLRKILRFRTRDFWSLLRDSGAAVGAGPDVPVFVVVQGGRRGLRLARAVRGLSRRSLTAHVLDAATARTILASHPGATSS